MLVSCAVRPFSLSLLVSLFPSPPISLCPYIPLPPSLSSLSLLRRDKPINTVAGRRNPRFGESAASSTPTATPIRLDLRPCALSFATLRSLFLACEQELTAGAGHGLQDGRRWLKGIAPRSVSRPVDGGADWSTDLLSPFIRRVVRDIHVNVMF